MSKLRWQDKILPEAALPGVDVDWRAERAELAALQAKVDAIPTVNAAETTRDDLGVLKQELQILLMRCERRLGDVHRECFRLGPSGKQFWFACKDDHAVLRQEAAKLVGDIDLRLMRTRYAQRRAAAGKGRAASAPSPRRTDFFVRRYRAARALLSQAASLVPHAEEDATLWHQDYLDFVDEFERGVELEGGAAAGAAGGGESGGEER